MSLVTIDEVQAALNLGDDITNLVELELYIDAVTAHVTERVGELPSSEYVERLVPRVREDGVARFLPSRRPVLTVVSISDRFDNEYTTGFTITPDDYIEHDNANGGTWTVTYTAGFATVPADLKLAVLEDIRGLYHPGQIGPAANFGAYGVEATESVNPYRPVSMWPRVDRWMSYRFGPAHA